MKQYITWQTLWLNNQEGRHIDANINRNWDYETNPITYEQINISETENDKRQIGIINIPDTYSESVIERFYKSLYSFAVEKITPSKALEIALEKYGEGSFSLDVDDFTLIDNREIEEM